MEVALKRSVNEEKRVQDGQGGEEVGKVGNGQVHEENCSKQLGTSKQEDHELECAKAEMGEVREENERLKMLLTRIVKDYQSLQMKFIDIVKQDDESKKSPDTTSFSKEIEEPEFVSLSLGRVSSDKPKKDEKKHSNNVKNDELIKEGLALGLDRKFELPQPGSTETVSNPSLDNSFEEPKEEEAGEACPPTKILKTMRSGDDEVSQQTQVKKTRVAVRTRCDTPTMNDGCQWRKYGQKIAKGNPCPRAYYRCTVAPTCPVRKQVQRCVEDMSILITTYEGTHNHPLSVSASAMASTTSAAASMLISGSSNSQTTLETSANLHGLNFNLPNNSNSRQFYLPNSSFSSSPSHPTITLDLTIPPSLSSSSSKFPSPSLNFSSSQLNNLPTSWCSNGYLNYGTQPYNQNPFGSLNFGRQVPQEHLYQPITQKNNSNPPQQSLTDTIEAATQVITSDPSFQSALASAITSIIGNDGNGENFGKNLKWGDAFSAMNSSPSVPNANGFASNYLNR